MSGTENALPRPTLVFGTRILITLDSFHFEPQRELEGDRDAVDGMAEDPVVGAIGNPKVIA